MAIKLADTLAPMADFPAAMAEHVEFSDGKSLQEKYDLGELGGEGGGGHIELTQAEYNALSDEEKNNGAIYFITDAIGGGDEVEVIEYAYSIVEPAGSFSIYYSYEDLATKIGCYVPVTTYNHKYGEWVVNIYVVRQNDEGNIEIINESGYETIIAPIGTGTVVTLPFVKDTRVSSQTTWSSKQIASALLGDDQLNEYSNNSVQNWVLAGKFKEIEDKLDGESGVTTYSSLEELGLTAPVTVGDIFNAMPDSSMAVIACEDVTEHITDVPMHYGVLTIKKSAVGRFSIDFQNSLASSPCNVKRWIGTLKGDDGTGLYWREVAYKENLSIYKSLSELGLDTTATLKDITRAMAKSSMIAIKVDAMANQNEYNNITQGTATIFKIEDARIQAIMTNKVDGRTWIGTLDGENTIVGWKELRSDSPYHRVVVQEKAGYFKFKPTSTGTDQPLRISVTDNYGGMINISGAKPSASQYKPFKCIRLSNGEYTNYDAIKVANNKMLKLFYYDGYFYLKVTTYTTCTFTGLLEAPTYIETFEEKDAEEIPIRSVFDTPYNDGYADPSIIAIGDTDSADGIIKTLTTLGFTGDVMTWDTGEYRISHVGGLTNLPSEITEEKPGLRIAHYDMKKWGSNHNPYASTYGCRQSVLYYKGDVYVRYTESGATAGVLITDTGWNNISNKKSIKFNSKTFKIDITKGNENWNGNMKFGYCIDESYGEIIISSLGKTEVMWDHSTGVRYVKSVTYTIDPNNKAHVTIGIELYDVSYGTHQLEVIGDFARINSITGDAFTGTSVAKRGATRGRNNGVGILCNVEDLGLTTPCTTVQIAQAMRNLANKMTRIPASGMIGIFEGDKSLITDAPYDYGLLHIECYGYDRILIRFEGIGSSSYKGSWIGKVIGGGGTFSEITWEQFGYNDVALTTVTIPNSYITGTLQWEVKKGICYVSWENFKCTKANFTYTLTSNKLPTPLRTNCLPMYASTGEHIGVINIPKDGSTPTFVSTDKISLASNGCFGYEIA